MSFTVDVVLFMLLAPCPLQRYLGGVPPRFSTPHAVFVVQVIGGSRILFPQSELPHGGTGVSVQAKGPDSREIWLPMQVGIEIEGGSWPWQSP